MKNSPLYFEDPKLCDTLHRAVKDKMLECSDDLAHFVLNGPAAEATRLAKLVAFLSGICQKLEDGESFSLEDGDYLRAAHEFTWGRMNGWTTGQG
jgi:hypothetical protein